MAVTSLQLTYGEIRDHIGLMISANRSTGSWHSNTSSDVLLIMRSGFRKTYYPPALGDGRPPYEWSFLKPADTIATNLPYSTGTIEVANGVTTLSAGTFPSWAVDGWLVYNGKYYEVASRDSNTQLTLVNTADDNDAAAGTSYSLLQYRFALPSTFESLEGPLYWHPDQSNYNRPLEKRSDDFLRRLYQDGDYDAFACEPEYYALVPGPVNTTAAQAWYMLIFPAPRAVFHLKYRYKIRMFDLDAVNQYPPGGAQFSELLLEACLSEVELKLNDMEGPHTMKWRELLAAAVTFDQQNATPDTLGVLPIQPPDYVTRSQFPHDHGYVIREGHTLADYEV